MNSSTLSFLLIAGGLGFGYSMERLSQGAPPASMSPLRDPAWLRDLDADYQDVVAVMKQKGFTVDENARVCNQRDIFGYYTWGHRTVKICTDRIAQLNREPSAFRESLQLTIAHEGVHVAQSCRQQRGGKPSLDLAASRLYSLPASTQTVIQMAIERNRSSKARSVQWRIEAEAMALEGRPEQVIAALRTFCR